MHAHGPAPHGSHAGHDAVGRGVSLLVTREEEVFLERRAGIEEELQPIADEELAFFLELLPILDVSLLDAGTLLEVSLLAHARQGPGCGLGLAQRMMISTPLPWGGPPSTAGAPGAAMMLAFISGRSPLRRRTFILTRLSLHLNGDHLEPSLTRNRKALRHANGTVHAMAFERRVVIVTKEHPQLGQDPVQARIGDPARLCGGGGRVLARRRRLRRRRRDSGGGRRRSGLERTHSGLGRRHAGRGTAIRLYGGLLSLGIGSWRVGSLQDSHTESDHRLGIRRLDGPQQGCAEPEQHRQHRPQERLQPFPRVVQPRHHRADRTTEHICDFPIGEALDVTEHDNRSRLVRQGIQGLPDPMALLGLDRRLVRTGARVGHGALPLLLGQPFGAKGARLRPARSLPVRGDVHGDAEEPGVERRLASKRWERVEGTDERFLGAVPRFFAVAQHLVRETPYTLAVTLDQGFER